MAAIEPNQRLVNTYKTALADIIGDGICTVSSTHRDTNLCFNCSEREILLALQKCFLFETTFKENMLGQGTPDSDRSCTLESSARGIYGILP